MRNQYTGRKYRTVRPSKPKRLELTKFYDKLYKKDDLEVPTKTKVPAKKAPAGLVYTDKDGKEKTVAVGRIKSYDETNWFSEVGTLFPQIPEDRQATFGRTAGSFDEDGRPSLTARNLVILDVHHMSKGPYGNWFLMHVVADGEDELSGEWTVPTRGQAVNEAIEALSGVSLETGKRIAPGELPVALRVEFATGEGEYEGYYYPTAPIAAADAERVS